MKRFNSKNNVLEKSLISKRYYVCIKIISRKFREINFITCNHTIYSQAIHSVEKLSNLRSLKNENEHFLRQIKVVTKVVTKGLISHFAFYSTFTHCDIHTIFSKIS